MQMTIAGLLSPEELASICKALDKVEFIDGRETAGWAAKTGQKQHAGAEQ